MNAKQKRLILTGLLLVIVFIFLEPIRTQNPFYIPVLESLFELTDQRFPAYLNAPNSEMNWIAAGLVMVATVIGFVAMRDRQATLQNRRLTT